MLALVWIDRVLMHCVRACLCAHGFMTHGNIHLRADNCESD